MSQFVVRYFADECHISTQARNSRQSVGTGTTARARRCTNCLGELNSSICFDERHRALHHVVGAKEVIVHHGDHVHKGIADADNVVEDAVFIGEGWNMGGKWMTTWHGSLR